MRREKMRYAISCDVRPVRSQTRGVAGRNTGLNATGGGTLIGGCMQRGNWDSQVDPNLANRIMKRAVDLCPALTGGKGIEHLSIIRHGVGLRPLRLGGTRLEKDQIDGIRVVHNYGHGGYGYQSSYGCSQEAVKLVDEVLRPAEGASKL